MSSSADAHRRPAAAPRVLRGAASERFRSAELVTSAGTAALESLSRSSADGAAELLGRERAEAYAAGREAGLAEALAAADQARAAALAGAGRALAAAAEAAGRQREALVQEVTGEAIDLTYELVRAVLGDEAVTAALPPAAVLARAIALAPEGEHLVVRVAPSFPIDLAELAGHCDPERVTVRADPSIQPGGCVVEVGACRIDGQISTALERVRKVLDEARAGHGVTGR